MGKIIRSRIRAATILESIVALTILLVLFGISISLFVQVNLHGGSEKDVKAEQLLNEFSQATITEKRYFDEDIEKSGFILKKLVTEYPGKLGLLQIHYLVYDSNKKLLLDWNELVSNDNEA